MITRSVFVRNKGNTPIVLERVHSLCMDIPYGDWEWIHFQGRHTMERQTERLPVFCGIQESSSTRGTSSHQQNPAVLLCGKNCTETVGECMGALLMYSGGFQTQIEKDQLGQTRMVMGIHPRYVFVDARTRTGISSAGSDSVLFRTWNGKVIAAVSSCNPSSCMQRKLSVVKAPSVNQ